MHNLYAGIEPSVAAHAAAHFHGGVDEAYEFITDQLNGVPHYKDDPELVDFLGLVLVELATM